MTRIAPILPSKSLTGPRGFLNVDAVNIECNIRPSKLQLIWQGLHLMGKEFYPMFSEDSRELIQVSTSATDIVASWKTLALKRVHPYRCCELCHSQLTSAECNIPE